jgi:hypothetical protein
MEVLFLLDHSPDFTEIVLPAQGGKNLIITVVLVFHVQQALIG